MGRGRTDIEDQAGIAGSELVCVAICTRERPRMLAAALASLARLEPCSRELRVIVVHNASEMVAPPPLDGMIAAAYPAFAPIQLIEPEIGIAQARNRALDEALAMGCRWLAFLDDDETADPRWLANLLAAATGRGLTLVGGPVRMLPPADDATSEERIVWCGVSQRFAATERRSAGKALRSTDNGITIVTNNWMCDLEFVRRHGLRFDNSTALSGGEDTQFYRSLVSLGGKSGWASDAIVYEEWPRERLTLDYHRRRGHDQSAGRFERKWNEQGALVLPEALATVAARACAAGFWRLKALFDGGVSRVRAARSIGAARGVIAALRGERQSHYQRVTGN